jgi:hypothetical protein
MRKLENIDIIGSDGKPAPLNVKKELAVLLSSLDLCVRGNGLPLEAMEIAQLLSAIFRENKISAKPGCALPDWAGALVEFYLASGLLGMAVKVAAFRGSLLDEKELNIYRRALDEKKKYQAQCFELADIFSQSGLIVQAAAAAKLAGRDLTESNLEAISQQVLMGKLNENSG